MTTGSQVMQMLRPNGGYYIAGNDFDSLFYDKKCKPVTKEEFEAGFMQYDAWKIQQDAEAQTKRQALLDRLGITAEEAKLLLG
jgi:hypothetical protein